MNDAEIILSMAKMAGGTALAVITAMGGFEMRRSKAHTKAEKERAEAAALAEEKRTETNEARAKAAAAREERSIEATRSLTTAIGSVKETIVELKSETKSHYASDAADFSRLGHEVEKVATKVDELGNRITRLEAKS